MKTRTKTKSTKVPDEVLTTAPLQKALSSTEGLQKWRAKFYKDPQQFKENRLEMQNLGL